MQPDHRILINKAGDRYSVTVDPVPAGESFAAGFDTHKAARGFAGGVRMTRGWPIVDLTTGHLEALSGLNGGEA